MADLAYARTLNYVIGFPNGVMEDTVTGDIGGQLNRRLSFTGNAFIRRGQVGLDRSSTFDSKWGFAMLQAAVTRRVSAFLQYTIFDQQTQNVVGTLPLVSAPLSRQAVVAGVSFWAPLLTKPRARR